MPFLDSIEPVFPRRNRLIALVGTFCFAALLFFASVRPLGERVEDIGGLSNERRQIAAAAMPLLPDLDVQPPGLEAEAYVVWVLGDEKPILAQRAEKPMPPASLTKLVTALIAREHLAAGDRVIFSKSAKAIEPIESDAQTGEEFQRDDAIRLALITSANDAAVALAESVGMKRGAHDGEEAMRIFAALMREKKQSLGLDGSEFQNPTGLDQDGHLMSAKDIARVLEYINEYHQGLLEISRTIEVTIRSLALHPSDISVGKTAGRVHRLSHTNELIKEFPAVLGSKTGFTDNAKGTLAFLYPVKHGRTVVAVLLGSTDRFGDGRKIIRWLEEAFP